MDCPRCSEFWGYAYKNTCDVCNQFLYYSDFSGFSCGYDGTTCSTCIHENSSLNYFLPFDYDCECGDSFSVLNVRIKCNDCGDEFSAHDDCGCDYDYNEAADNCNHRYTNVTANIKCECGGTGTIDIYVCTGYYEYSWEDENGSGTESGYGCGDYYGTYRKA